MPARTSAEMAVSVGDRIEDIETPAVIVNVDVMERNIDEYVAFAEEQGVALRSHAKTHKNVELAHHQCEKTGSGIVCQKLSEAEVMAAHGIDDIYLSYSVVGPKKLQRLLWVASKTEKFATTVDHPHHVDALQNTAENADEEIHVVVELDVGLDRTGVRTVPELVRIVERVDSASNLVFDGILAYEAHVKKSGRSRAEYVKRCTAAMEYTQTAVNRIESAGIEVKEVKVGGTTTSRFSGTHSVVTEINPGMYPFNDVSELRSREFEVTKDNCALTALTTVVSTPTENRAIVDAGSKSISMDKPYNPLPKRERDITYANASEEHGWLDVGTDESLAIGDRLEFIVPHVCPTINLHDVMYGVSDGRVTDIWTIQARGKVQ